MRYISRIAAPLPKPFGVHSLFWIPAAASVAFLGCGDSGAKPASTPPGIEAGAPQEKDTSMRDDLQAVTQATLDLPALQQYFHEAIPERRPLRIVNGAGLPEGLPLSKFGAPVVWVSLDEVKKAGSPYLEFTRVDVSGDTATVTFRYPIEGISGSVRLRRKSGAWSVEATDLSEGAGGKK